MALRWLATAVAVIGLGIASYWSVRLAYADVMFQRGVPDEVTEAVRLAPGNAKYRALHALQLDYAGEDPKPVLRETVGRVDPLDAEAWMQLGLRLETERNLAEAERCLAQAARVSKQFDPRWTLANYYFRREDRERFWQWAREALLISYGDRRPLFDLCRRMAQRPEEILERAIPDRPLVLTAYLQYLVEQDLMDAAWLVSQRVLGEGDPAGIPLLLDYCERLLGTDPSRALQLWTEMCHARLVPYASPGAGRLVNGDFAVTPLSRGFDWHVATIDGVSTVRMDAPMGLRIALSGNQPEQCVPVFQTVHLEQGRRYKLHWRSRLEGTRGEPGVAWRIGDAVKTLVSTEDWRDEGFEFEAPSEFVRLSLEYRRPMGSARLEGVVLIGDVVLEPVQ